MKKVVEFGKGSNSMSHTNANGVHRELMRLPNSHQPDTSSQYAAQDKDDFIASESDRQLLLIKYFIFSLFILHTALNMAIVFSPTLAYCSLNDHCLLY